MFSAIMYWWVYPFVGFESPSTEWPQCQYRTLQTVLSATPESLKPARVIWTSSLEGHRSSLDLDDYQLLKTEHSYEATKYQTELIATHLSRHTASEGRIRHFVSHPGVVHTNVFSAALTWFTDALKILAFYIVSYAFRLALDQITEYGVPQARLCGSPHHPITPFKGAVSAVHLCLVSLSVVPLYLSSLIRTPTTHQNGHANGHAQINGDVGEADTSPNWLDPPVKFGSETDRWGNPRIGLQEINAWRENERNTAALVDRCERLYRGLVEAEGRTWTEF